MAKNCRAIFRRGLNAYATICQVILKNHSQSNLTFFANGDSKALSRMLHYRTHEYCCKGCVQRQSECCRLQDLTTVHCCDKQKTRMALLHNQAAFKKKNRALNEQIYRPALCVSHNDGSCGRREHRTQRRRAVLIIAEKNYNSSQKKKNAKLSAPFCT